MEITILIVTKNRVAELEITLQRLMNFLDLNVHEVLVFIDYCQKTNALISKYPWVIWEYSDKSIGASPARNKLYKKAKGKILIGLDDDSHPLEKQFIAQTEAVFLENKNIAIIAFQEIRGVFLSDEVALSNSEKSIQKYVTSDFVGSGFAIRKEVYDQTRGFPEWIDIYGEESCLAIEAMDLGYEIWYDNTIKINHRIDRQKRLLQGRNYFRFERQLRNTIYYFMVYYPNPFLKIAKLLFHNFKKYAIQDWNYFRLFCKAVFVACTSIFYILKFRKQIKNSTFQKIKILKGIKYS
jgi:GT2 family glycosyltransferase